MRRWYPDASGCAYGFPIQRKTDCIICIPFIISDLYLKVHIAWFALLNNPRFDISRLLLSYLMVCSFAACLWSNWIDDALQSTYKSIHRTLSMYSKTAHRRSYFHLHDCIVFSDFFLDYGRYRDYNERKKEKGYGQTSEIRKLKLVIRF